MVGNVNFPSLLITALCIGMSSGVSLILCYQEMVYNPANTTALVYTTAVVHLVYTTAVVQLVYTTAVVQLVYNKAVVQLVYNKAVVQLLSNTAVVE